MIITCTWRVPTCPYGLKLMAINRFQNSLKIPSTWFNWSGGCLTMDPRNQGEKSRRGFLYKEDNDDPFSWRFLIVFNKEDAHNGGKMAASGGMSDKFCNKVNDSLLSKHIFVNWQIIPREDGPTYTYMLVDRPFNHYSSSIVSQLYWSFGPTRRRELKRNKRELWVGRSRPLS